jgi:hypothetical protein
MKAALSSPDSPEARAWCDQCSRKIHEIEPRLAPADCDDLSSSLWQLDVYQCLPPRDAAEKFMADNLEMLASVLTA